MTMAWEHRRLRAIRGSTVSKGSGIDGFSLDVILEPMSRKMMSCRMPDMILDMILLEGNVSGINACIC